MPHDFRQLKVFRDLRDQVTWCGREDVYRIPILYRQQLHFFIGCTAGPLPTWSGREQLAAIVMPQSSGYGFCGSVSALGSGRRGSILA